MISKIIITSGGTTEKIDDVRSITNKSTGKLSSLVAYEFYNMFPNIKIVYICSCNAVIPSIPNMDIIKIKSAMDLYRTIKHLLSKEKFDAVIHAMAVSDYSVKGVTTANNLAETIAHKINGLKSDELTNTKDVILDCINGSEHFFKNVTKIDSNFENLMIYINKAPKIISIIKELQPSTILVGFKLLSGVNHKDLIEIGHNLLIKNKCDFVLANDLSTIQDDNHVGFLIDTNGYYEKSNTKEDIAKSILQSIIKKQSE